MCTFNALPIAPRQLMLQNAQHCSPKKERIHPLQFLEGVYGNSVRAEKSLRTLPEKKVLKFSRNGFQKNTPPVSSRGGSKFTLRIQLRSVASRKTRIWIRHAGINVKVKAQQKKRLYRSRHEKRTTKVVLVKATKHKANPRQLTRFVWRTETMVLPDYQVAITKQSKDC